MVFSRFCTFPTYVSNDRAEFDCLVLCTFYPLLQRLVALETCVLREDSAGGFWICASPRIRRSNPQPTVKHRVVWNKTLSFVEFSICKTIVKREQLPFPPKTHKQTTNSAISGSIQKFEFEAICKGQFV